MQVIQTFYGPEDAMTALSLLQAHDIDAKLLDSATLSILPLDSVALGGYRLAVPKRHVQDAIALLANQNAPDIAPENQQYFGDAYEVEARSAEHRHGRKNFRRVFMIVVWVFVFLFALRILTGSSNTSDFASWLF